jgi:hypothetical protein
MKRIDHRVILSARIDPAARDCARVAARAAGLEFSRWVERAIMRATAKESADRALADARIRATHDMCYQD